MPNNLSLNGWVTLKLSLQLRICNGDTARPAQQMTQEMAQHFGAEGAQGPSGTAGAALGASKHPGYRARALGAV